MIGVGDLSLLADVHEAFRLVIFLKMLIKLRTV